MNLNHSSKCFLAVKSYELRYVVNNLTKLSTNFEFCPSIPGANLTEGNLNNPQNAGLQEKLVFNPRKFENAQKIL